MEVYLGLGSNQGDRQRNLEQAIESLKEKLGSAPVAVSDFIKTESWGFEGPEFLNAAVRFDLEISEDNLVDEGLELLDKCKAIEEAMGRTGAPEYSSDGTRIYHDRPIDIDILLIGEHRIDHPRLQVPHPLMEQRDFVMVPLRQILR